MKLHKNLHYSTSAFAITACMAIASPTLAQQTAADAGGLETIIVTAQIREDIARVIPSYQGIQHLHQKGDQIQWVIVTAEPYFAVTQPSDVVVMENVVREGLWDQGLLAGPRVVPFYR